MNCVARWALALLVLCCFTITGCATIVKGSTQTLTVQTEPDGANCELTREGQTIGAINPTPGTVQIDKNKNDIEITCKKKGYSNAVVTVSSTFQSWTVGNILLGGLIGIAVDASSGAINEYPSSVELKLMPDKFSSTEDQEDFYEKWRMEVLRNSAKVKIAASKTCIKEQCDEVSKRIDKETELALAGIDANRSLRSKPAEAAVPVAQVPIQRNGTAASVTGTGKVGSRWKYKLTDVRRPAGVITVEVIEQRGKLINERITADGEKSFFAERSVDADFSPSRFQQTVTLPGGFQMTEISPYAAPNVEFRPGQTWKDISGRYLLQHIGNQQFLAELKVVGKETVRVPAGSFEAWKLEATSVNVWSGTTVRMKFTYWYAPEMSRTVKMMTETSTQVSANGVGKDIYELMSYEPGK